MKDLGGTVCYTCVAGGYDSVPGQDSGREDSVNADALFVVDRGRSFALRRWNGWGTVFEVGSKEELDLKLAVMGLGADWSSKFGDYSIWPVRELRR